MSDNNMERLIATLQSLPQEHNDQFFTDERVQSFMEELDYILPLAMDVHVLEESWEDMVLIFMFFYSMGYGRAERLHTTPDFVVKEKVKDAKDTQD